MIIIANIITLLGHLLSKSFANARAASSNEGPFGVVFLFQILVRKDVSQEE